MFHGNGVGSLNPDIVVTTTLIVVQQVNFYDSTRNFKLLIVFCLMNDVICFIYFNMIIIIIKQWRKIIVLNDGQLLSIAVMKQCLIAIHQFQLTIIN